MSNLQNLIKQEAKKYKNAPTIFRDKEGIIVDKEELIAQSEEAKKQKIQKLNEERINEWGVGFKQKQDQESRKKHLENIKEQNFSNYQVSREVEREMLEKDRFGDPMEKLLKVNNIIQILPKKTQVEGQANQPEKFYLGKKCKYAGYPNRFGIQPGYRWDGCDRGNGYEQKYFQSQNQKKAKVIEEYQQNQKEM